MSIMGKLVALPSVATYTITVPEQPLHESSMNMKKPAGNSLVRRVMSWFVSEPTKDPTGPDNERIDWSRAVPYILIHLACLGVIWTGWSWPAVAMAVFFYALRVFTL